MNAAPASRGFVALMAVIVIGFALLGIAAEEGRAGWYARYNVLSAERKEQASALAEGCADQALAELLANPSFDSSEPRVVESEIGTCTVEVDTVSTPGLVLVKSRGEVGDAVANLELALSLGQVRLGGADPEGGTLIVGMAVEGVGAALADFTVSVPGASPSSFTGTGRRALAATGPYIITVDGPETYRPRYSGECDENGRGTLTKGDAHSCAIVLEEIPTTLSVVVNVINDDGGARSPAEFPLAIDGVSVVEGVPNTVSAGTHSVSAPSSDTAYAASSFGGDCDSNGSVLLKERDERVCVITYNDRPGAAVCTNTGYAAPTTSTGQNSWLDPLGLIEQGGVVAYTIAAATGDYFGFGLPAIPSEDTVAAVAVQVDARSSSGSCALGVKLSPDGGVTWTNEKTRTLQNSFSTLSFGGAGDAWVGHTFTSEEVADTSRFRVRVRDIDTGAACANDARTDVDFLRARLSHGAPSCVVSDTGPGTGEPALIVETVVINDDGGTALPGSLRVDVEGAIVPGTSAPGARYEIGAGTYAVVGQQDPRYQLFHGENCTSDFSGPLGNGEVRRCVIRYDDLPPNSSANVDGIVLDSWRELPSR